MTDPGPNVPLLREAVQWAEIEAAKGERSLWRQDEYMQQTDCGTAYCIAGYVIANASGVTIVSESRAGRPYYHPLVNGHLALWGSTAQRLLGLTEDEADDLFAEWNTIEDVRDVAARIAARAGETL